MMPPSSVPPGSFHGTAITRSAGIDLGRFPVRRNEPRDGRVHRHNIYVLYLHVRSRRGSAHRTGLAAVHALAVGDRPAARPAGADPRRLRLDRPAARPAPAGPIADPARTGRPYRT